MNATLLSIKTWQTLAAVPKEQFDAAFAQGGRPSVAEIIGKKPNAALWVCGRVPVEQGEISVKPAILVQIAEEG